MLSLDQQFAAWVRTKPADETYNYWCDECAFGQFLQDRGISATMYENGWNEGSKWSVERDHPFDPKFAEALQAEPHTFGALAQRLSA